MKVFAVDFDGTLYLGPYPGISNEFNLPLINKIMEIQNSDVDTRWILWTCRNAEDLEIAISALRQFPIHWDAINDNIEEIKALWRSNPRKIFADYYIDDKSVTITEFLGSDGLNLC